MVQLFVATQGGRSRPDACICAVSALPSALLFLLNLGYFLNVYFIVVFIIIIVV